MRFKELFNMAYNPDGFLHKLGALKFSQGIYKESNNTFTVLTFSKSWNYKTEKAAAKKWESLVKADLV